MIRFSPGVCIVQKSLDSVVLEGVLFVDSFGNPRARLLNFVGAYELFFDC